MHFCPLYIIFRDINRWLLRITSVSKDSSLLRAHSLLYLYNVNTRKYILSTGLLLLAALGSCKEEEKVPFTTGSSFVYATTYTTPDGRKTKHDTLSFTIQKRDITSYALDLKKIRWENTRHDYYQIRGLNTKDEMVELQLPINYAGFENENMAIAGHPTVSLSGGNGYSMESEDTYVKGYGKLSGLTMKQRSVYLRDTSVEFDGGLLRCQLLERYNTSHIDTFGRYYVAFTYNPTYGFMTMDYKYPNGRHITLRLIDVEIIGR